jgi:hypothetical protein
MNEQDQNQTTTQPNNPPAAPTAQSNQPDTSSIELAKKVGELEKVTAELEDYKKKADPILETIFSDPDLYTKTTEVHNRRLGIATDPAPDKSTSVTPPPVSSDTDTRMALVNKTQLDFEATVGIDKLPEAEKQAARGMIGQMIKEMVDPKGNKTIAKVFEEISLVKLPWYLDKAYQLINRDKDISSALERGKNEVLSQYEGDRGMMGGMPSSSASSEELRITPKEREVASKMGLSEEEYINNKKDILNMRD